VSVQFTYIALLRAFSFCQLKGMCHHVDLQQLWRYNNNSNNNERICIALVCRLTSEALFCSCKSDIAVCRTASQFICDELTFGLNGLNGC